MCVYVCVCACVRASCPACPAWSRSRPRTHPALASNATRARSSAASHPYSGCSQTHALGCISRGVFLLHRRLLSTGTDRAPRPGARRTFVLRQHLKLKLNALLVSIDQHARTVAVANPCLFYIFLRNPGLCHLFVHRTSRRRRLCPHLPVLELGLSLLWPKHEARALVRALAPPAPSNSPSPLSPQPQSWFDRIDTPSFSITNQHMTAAHSSSPLCA